MLYTALAGALLAPAAASAARLRADLVATGQVRPAGTDAVSVGWRVTNRGRAAARPTSLAFLLSADRRRNRSDRRIGPRPSVKRLKARKRVRGTALIPLPAAQRAGRTYLLVCADGRSRLREAREGNNCAAARLPPVPARVIGSPPAPPALTLPPPPPGPAPSPSPTPAPTPQPSPASVGIAGSSPAAGEGGVSVSREVRIDFTGPVSLAGDAVSAEFAGTRLDTLVDLSQDRRSIRMFFPDRLPASARVRVRVDGDALSTDRGEAVDADGDGDGGGTGIIDFDTLSLTPLAGTRVCGTVIAAEQVLGADRPLAGVTISIDGAEETLKAATAADGTFCLDPAPGAPFFVHIDGRTAITPKPAGAYYPFVGKRWEPRAGTTVDIDTVHLPLVAADALQPVSPTQDTDIGLPASALAQYPQYAGVKITVPADALFAEDGSRGGRVGLALVPPDRLPGPLPPGADPALVITVQSDLGTDFDQPAPVCLPNLPSASGEPAPAPGAKVALVSFDHDEGDWVPAGSMTVSGDGGLACSDPGSGVREPGWHYVGGQVFEVLGKVFSGEYGRENDAKIAEQLERVKTAKANDGDLEKECTELGALQARGEYIEAAEKYVDLMAQSYTEGVATLTGQRAVEVAAKFANSLAKVLASIRETGEVDAHTLAEVSQTGSRDYFKSAMSEAIDFFDEDDLVDQEVRTFAQGYKNAAKAISLATLLDKLRQLPIEGQKLIDLSEQMAERTKQLAAQCLDTYGASGQAPDEAVTDHQDAVNEAVERAVEQADAAAKAFEAGNEMVDVIDTIPPTGTNDPQEVSEVAESIERTIELIGAWDEIVQVGPIVIPPPPEEYPSEDALGPPETPPRIGIFLPRDGAPSGECGTLADPLARVLRPEVSAQGTYRVLLDGDECGEIALIDPVTGATVRIVHIGSLLRGRTAVRDLEIPVTPTTTALEIEVPPGAGALAAAPLDVDPDDDGLDDIGERVVGTDRDDPDSDDDGIGDLAELRAGTDPNDDAPVRTGVIASVDTPGIAVDVDAADGLAAVADSQAGVALLDVDRAGAPVTIGRVDTPGDARGVALSGDRLVVADGSAGIAVVDVSDPPAARIVAQTDLGAPVTRVAAGADVAYAVVGGAAIAVVDLATGREIDRVTPRDGVEDVALAEERLYVVQQGHLRILRDFASGLDEIGSASQSGMDAVFMRVHAGGGRAWVSHAFPGGVPGWRVFDVTDPGAPALVGAPPTPQEGAYDIAPDGSGLVLTAAQFAGQPQRAVAVFDGSDPADVTDLIEAFPTPGSATAIAMYGGLAYVADAEAGLQVVNVRPFDAGGTPPAVALDTSGAEATERGAFRVSAVTTDDVQVASVDFLLDGVVVATDGSFPFEHRFLAPPRSRQTSMTLTARAVDTGGNAAGSAPVVVPIVADAAPPRVRRTSPAEGRSVAPGTRIAVSVVFDEPIDRSTLTAQRLRVFGPSGAPLAGTVTVNQDARAAVVNLAAPLTALGEYRIAVGPGIADGAGNAMPAEVSRTFRVSQSQLPPGGSVLMEGTIQSGTRDELALVAEAGQRVFADVEALGNDCDFIDLQLTIERPDGAPVIDDHLMRFCTDHRTVELPVGGSYTVRVEGETAADFGPYRLRLHDVPDPDEFEVGLGETVAPGTPASGAGVIEGPGRSDVARFVGAAGQRVFLDVLAVDGACDHVGGIGWELLRPDGTPVVGFRPFSACFDRGPITLDATGTHTLVVRADEGSDFAGTYRLVMRAVPDPQVAPLTLGVEQAGAIESPGASDEWTFTGAAGQRVFLDSRSVRGGCGFVGDLGWELLRPDGTALVAHQAFSVCVDRGPVTLDATGTWRLVARAPAHDDGTGAYTFAVHDVPAPDVRAIAIGDEVSGEIETPGAEDRYTFDVTAGTSVLIDVHEVQGACGFVSFLGTELLRPNGTALLPYAPFGACEDRGPVALAVSGTWTLVVRAPANNETLGTYRLTLAAAQGAAGAARLAAEDAGGSDSVAAEDAGGSGAVVARWTREGLAAASRRGLTPARSARVHALLAVAQDRAAGAARGSREIDRAVEDASRLVLADLFPDEADRFEADRAPGAPGRRAAEAVLARAASDGADRPPSRTIPMHRGGWEPTPPLLAWPSDPAAGAWRTWNIARGDAIAVPPAPAPGSAEEHREHLEIYRISRRLTARQRRIAIRWEARRGTITPAGLWAETALRALERERASARRSARVLAALATAQADAMIAAWAVKYRHWSIRPITYIRREIDPGWTPLLRTPNFPGYVSGHSTTSAAAAAVLAAAFPDSARRWRAMAREAGHSRLLGGIHIRADDEAGAELGAAIGASAVAKAGRRLARAP